MENLNEKPQSINVDFNKSHYKIQRRWSIVGPECTQLVNSETNGHMTIKKPSELISSNVLHAMLGERNQLDCRPNVTRRSTMDHVSSLPASEFSPQIQSRRVSLDSMIMSFDGDRINQHNNILIEFSNTPETNQKKINSKHNAAKDFAQKESFHDNEVLTGNSHPNVPHPLIEYLPLYFVLKHFPNMLASISKIYAFRWDLHYPLQRRIPFSKTLRKIGIIATWGELLLWCPFAIILSFGILESFIYPSVSKSGIISRVPLFICFLTASHNSLITLILGIPVERAIKYHKVSGYLAFVNGIFHTYVAYVAHQLGATNDNVLKSFFVGDTVNLSGTLILSIIIGMILTSAVRVRRVAFEVFYYFHIVFAMCMLACAFYHSGIVVPIVGSIVWGGDVLIRKVYMAYCRNPREASIMPLTDTVVEIKMLKTKGFDYNPGQYVKICVPDISLFEWHPISISSSPYQHEVTLHIRARGSWTKRLYALSKKKNRFPVLIEGPYGSLSVDLTSKRYSMVMLISGGIGVTPMQSVAHQLVYEHEWGERHLKKLAFIWTSRDPEVVENMEVSSSMRKIEHQKGKRNLFENMSSEKSSDSSSVSQVNDSASAFLKNNTFFALPADFGAETFDDEIEDIDTDDESDDDSQKFNEFDIEMGVTSERVLNDSTCALSAPGSIVGSSSSSDEVLDLSCFLTSKDAVKSDIIDLPFVHPNRPDIKKIFLEMRDEAMRMKEKRVAVCICAPPQLVAMTNKACVKYSNKHVRFDFHYEVFE